MDYDADLKQSVLSVLDKNGTLNRIQAELRSAIYLAIENENKKNKLKPTVNNCPLECAVVYHFLKRNKFLATAAVFEKEVNSELISFEELEECTKNREKQETILKNLLHISSSQCQSSTDPFHEQQFANSPKNVTAQRLNNGSEKCNDNEALRRSTSKTQSTLQEHSKSDDSKSEKIERNKSLVNS
uniref:LisH domain-containing protein n=1 Tax=Syphacia muris TaxID=451379 RepID=A0A0N5AK90_9BILA